MPRAPRAAVPRFVEGGEKLGFRPTSRRESLHRRLLGTGDVMAAALALWLVLTLQGLGDPGLLVLAGTPLVVVLFKIAGLYDRDQMRLVHSTLDEAPTLIQLTGLYVLGVTIVAPVARRRQLSPRQIVASGLASFAAIDGRAHGGALARRAPSPGALPRASASRSSPSGSARRSRRAARARRWWPSSRSRATSSTPWQPGERAPHRRRSEVTASSSRRRRRTRAASSS